jgi:predicted dehydrogenase
LSNLRVGFIGCGRHATKNLYPCLKLAQMTPVAVCDLDEAKARRNARWFGAERVYTDHRHMLDQEALDAVLICTGPATHAALAMDVLDRGLPLFVEKPPAMTLAEADCLRARSEAAGVPIMVGLMKRHATIYKRLKAIVDDPAFGPVSAVQTRMAVGWKNGNGFALLLDMGIHYIDLLRAIMGDVVELRYQKNEPEPTHLTYAILLRFASGAVGTLHLSDQHDWMQPNERVEITGNGQFAVADNLTRLAHVLPGGKTEVWEPGFSIPNDENNSLFLGGFAGELQAWAAALRAGEPARASIADACAALDIIRQIEPDEHYEKGPQSFPHWKAEDFWLRDSET